MGKKKYVMWAVDATRQSVSDLFSEASGFPWHPQQGWPLEMLEIRHPKQLIPKAHGTALWVLLPATC